MSEQLSRNPADIEAETAADDAAYDGKWHDFSGIEVGDSEVLDDVIADVDYRREEARKEQEDEEHYRALDELEKEAQKAEQEASYEGTHYDFDEDEEGDVFEDEAESDFDVYDSDEDYQDYQDDEDEEDPLAGDVDKWVHPDETRTDSEIERDEEFLARKHMSGGDGSDDYWDDYHELHPEDDSEHANAH